MNTILALNAPKCQIHHQCQCKADVDALPTHVAVLAHAMLQLRSIFSKDPLDLQVTSVQHHAADAVIRGLQSNLQAASHQTMVGRRRSGASQPGKLITVRQHNALRTVAAPCIVFDSNETSRSKSLCVTLTQRALAYEECSSLLPSTAVVISATQNMLEWLCNAFTRPDNAASGLLAKWRCFACGGAAAATAGIRS